MAELTQKEAGIIDSFKRRAQEFWTQWNVLNNSAVLVKNKSPEIQQEYNDLLKRGSIIRSSVETVTGLIDKAMSAYRTSTDWLIETFSGVEKPNLGVIPLLIPGAIIAGSLAAMGKWLKDVYIFNQKMEKIAQLESRGIDPVTASNIVDRIDSSGFNFKIVGLPLLLIGGFFAYQMYRKKRKRHGRS